MQLNIEELCAEVLARVETREVSLRGAIEDFRRRGVVKARVRAVITALSLSVLRNYKLLDTVLKECGVETRFMDPRDRWLWRVAAYEVMFRGFDPRNTARRLGLDAKALLCCSRADVKELVSGLREVEKLSILYSQPEWVVKYLIKLLGVDECVKLLEAFNTRHPTWVRVRRGLKEVFRHLKNAGVEFEEDNDVPNLVKVTRSGGRLVSLKPFRECWCVVQDKASVIPPLELAPTKGDVVFDACSAPGMKTLALHDLIGSGKNIVSADLSRRRASEQVRLLRKCSAYSNVIVADCRNPPLRPAFTKVLVDPDCTALGKLGHSPEIRIWLEKRGEGIVNEMSREQLAILDSVAELCRRECTIVYSTCTLTYEENEGVVLEFLKRHSDFRVVELSIKVGRPGIGIESARRLYPHETGTIGYFIVKMVRG